jgi:DNA-binding NtrC family response regulator
MGKTIPSYPQELATRLATYEFPGNIRELQAMVFDSVSRTTALEISMERFGTIIKPEREKLPPRPDTMPSADIATSGGITFGRFPTLKEAETVLIDRALEIAGGNQGIAASLLGISRQALNNRLRRNPH